MSRMKKIIKLADLLEELDKYYTSKFSEVVDDFRLHFQSMGFRVDGGEDSHIASYKRRINVSLKINNEARLIKLKNDFMGTKSDLQIKIEESRRRISIRGYEDEVDKNINETSSRIEMLSNGESKLICRTSNREFERFLELLKVHY